MKGGKDRIINLIIEFNKSRCDENLLFGLFFLYIVILLIKLMDFVFCKLGLIKMF